MKKFLLSTVLLGIAISVGAEPFVSIRTEANPREIYIGDPIAVGIYVTVSSDVASVPFAPQQTFGEFELLSVSSPVVTFANDGKLVTEYRFLATTFSTGTVSIPSFPLAFSTTGGVRTEAKSEEFAIKVKSLLEEKGDEGNIRPLKGLYNFKSYFWLWMLLALSLLGVGGYFIWKWLSSHRGTVIVPAGPPRPPEEIAWEAIHHLEDADLISAGQFKEFYFQLSVILRQYLEGRYHMQSMEKTTSELLAEFRRESFSMDMINLCRNFLESADLVKFAKYTPEEQEVSNDLSLVKQFINLTTPQKQAAQVEEKIPV